MLLFSPFSITLLSNSYTPPRQLSSLEERLTSDVATILDLLHQTAGRGSTVQQAREVGEGCPPKNGDFSV